jgi:GDP-L-fucose synthase
MAALLDYVRAIRPDAILHLAAVSGGVTLSIQYPAMLLRDNVLMSINMLEVARILNVKKLVMTLSTGMYPEKARNPVKEAYIHDGPPHESNYSYAFAKRLIEPAIRAYRTEHKLNVIGLVPNGIFGENDDFGREAASMISALIRRFYENIDTTSDIVVWGDGSPLREHTYARDMARAFMWCLFHYDSGEIVNVGTNEEYSVRDIACMIAEELGIAKDRIRFDLSKPAGVYRKSTDNSKFMALTHFEFTPFRIGLRHTLQWFKENYDTLHFEEQYATGP